MQGFERVPFFPMIFESPSTWGRHHRFHFALMTGLGQFCKNLGQVVEIGIAIADKQHANRMRFTLFLLRRNTEIKRHQRYGRESQGPRQRSEAKTHSWFRSPSSMG